MKYLLIIIIFFVACRNESKTTESVSGQKLYFDLEKIVQADIVNNTENNCGEDKSVSVNGTYEKKSMDTVNWQRELQLITECDINKPNWKGKYDVRVFNDRQQYVYTANSSKIPIRKLTVNCEQDSGRVISVLIEKKTGTALFSNEQQIVYYPGKSFRINASQRALFMKDFNSEVEIKYLCNN